MSDPGYGHGCRWICSEHLRVVGNHERKREMTWKVKHEILLEAIAIGVMVVAILFLLASNSRSVESENESKIVSVEGKKQRQSPQLEAVVQRMTNRLRLLELLL